MMAPDTYMNDEIAFTKKGITTTAGLEKPSALGGKRCVKSAKSNIEPMKIMAPLQIVVNILGITYGGDGAHQ